MISRVVRYVAFAVTIYFSFIGVEQTFFGDRSVIFVAKITVYLLFCLAPVLILFLGIGGKETDV